MTISLEQHVRNWIADKAKDYDGSQLAVLEDLQKGGCQSGYVNHLIYSTDCRAFVAEYMVDIQEIINEIEENTGDKSFLFSENDGFSFDRLAWLAFEQVAYKIYGELENSEAAA